MLFERNPRQYRRPSTPARMRWARLIYVVCALTLVPSLFMHPHSEFGFAAIPGFHAFLAFLTGAALVLVAMLARWLLMRREDYYEHRT